jgi:hypothetical protein
MDIENVTRVAKLNDEFRTAGSSFMITNGVLHLSNVGIIVDMVRKFNNFNPSNDPHGEHDFGAFSFNGEEIYWKIDYYDMELKYGMSPLDPACSRVLSVLLSSEY